MNSEIRVALAGNPNSGKTTLFNDLTGSNQFVGNWPGVTVEKKEGKLIKHDDVTIVDLPGIYSLSPYTLEEVVARKYLIDERPDAILNIVDGTNLERNLYLTTQLIELGIPVVIAINMMDVVRKKGDRLDTDALAKRLGCGIIEISALRGEHTVDAAWAAVDAARTGKKIPRHSFSGPVEHALAHIEEAVVHDFPPEQQRWYAIKLFERDEKVLERFKLPQSTLAHIEEDIKAAEAELDDDAESIITNDRYDYITRILSDIYKKKNPDGLTTSDRIDRVVTSRWLGLPIFALIMFAVYWIAMIGVGQPATDWANDGLFGEGFNLFGIGDGPGSGIWVPGIPVLIGNFLEYIGCAGWLKSLILDGVISGVGSVLGFVPQMLVLFLMLAFIEACGYMSRVAFVLDRLFRRFGLSGKSFIPIIVGTGCGVPGIMASRTIENERDRRMTIMTTTFIPCGAKVPFIALIAGAVFGGSAWIATGAYLIGIASILCSGVILKKTKMFAGKPAPFVMELPEYHMPTFSNVMRSMWERGWSFIKKAGTIILLSSIVIWFLSRFGWYEGSFGFLTVEQISGSILSYIGAGVAWLFAPLGWGTWQAAVASITGLVGKENIVSTLGVLYGTGGSVSEAVGEAFSASSAMSFLLFNLLCAPCFAAIGAIRREMNSRRWTWFAIGYECLFAYAVAFVVFRLMSAFSGSGSVVGTVIAVIVVIGFFWLLFRPFKEATSLKEE